MCSVSCLQLNVTHILADHNVSYRDTHGCNVVMRCDDVKVRGEGDAFSTLANRLPHVCLRLATDGLHSEEVVTDNVSCFELAINSPHSEGSVIDSVNSSLPNESIAGTGVHTIGVGRDRDGNISVSENVNSPSNLNNLTTGSKLPKIR